MSTEETSPTLVVVARPQKARYSRKKARPVPSEEAASDAVDAYDDQTDEVEAGDTPAPRAANG